MADLNQPNVRIQVLIKEPTKYGEFSDALYYTPGEFESLKDDEILTATQSRIDEWVEFISTPVVAVALSLKELTDIKSDFQRQIDEIDLKISQL